MKIYVINRVATAYDENVGHVIVANSRKEVRALAEKSARDEEPSAWRAADIKCLGKYGKKAKKAFIVLTEFNA